MRRYVFVAVLFLIQSPVTNGLELEELFVTTPGSKANPEDRFIHLAVCAEEIGRLPALSEMQMIPINPKANAKGGCTNHSVVGSTVCKPSTFYGWLKGDAQWIVIARTQDEGTRSGMIGWNTSTGSSCFLDDNNRPPASADPAEASCFW